MIQLLVAFIGSFLLTMWVVRSSERHGHLSSDHDVSGPQKFHARPVPRIGGLGIFFGVLAAALAQALLVDDKTMLPFLLLLAGLPAFGTGIAEDLTKTQSPRRRLFFTAVAAVLAVYLVDGVVDRTGIPGLDWAVSVPVVAATLTVIAVAGLANAVNIIDGFNGLASMCCVIMLAGLAYVAFSVGDTTVAWMALAGVGAVLGFFVWNFPAGLVFLGDGGAYFLGFFLAELAILLIHRNPQVSPMFGLLLCIYPVFETLFSIYRRKWLRGVPVGMPDGAHLHSLIYRRFMRWAAGDRTARELTRRNSMTSPYLWILCSSSVIPAMLWYDYTAVLVGLILLFGLTYVFLYWRIVRFRVPRLLRRLGSRPMPLDAGDNRPT
jgi:UDP-N-acetylmuramyl pentapeptide phosphotransferase/UDP-N-acetylglucosamine-1-phosphate transferase